MSVEENKAVVRRSIEALNTRNWAVLDELTAPTYVNHNPLPGSTFINLANGFPDFQGSIEDIIAEGDRVVVRVTFNGTHTGEFMGVAPTNKQVTVEQIIIHRIVNGKIVEEWSTADLLGFFQRLGIIPPLK